jgi:hypothetical protein
LAPKINSDKEIYSAGENVHWQGLGVVMTPEFILPYVLEKSHAGGGDTPTEGITKIIQKFASITTNFDERRKANG